MPVPLRSPGLKARTQPFQGWDARFKSGGDHEAPSSNGLGRQPLKLQMPSSNLAGVIWVGRTAASAADCKSVDFGHRQFESGPAHLCLRDRVVYGAPLLRRCAVSHRWFESTRKREKRVFTN